MSIWLPGSGVVDLRVKALDKAVRDYDERLRVGRNEMDGNWCVFIQTERGTFPPTDLYPVLGLGLREESLPGPEEVLRRLYQADTVRHGDKNLDEMNRRNQAKKDAQEKVVKEVQAEVADAFQWGHSRMTNNIAGKRISVKMGEPAHRRRPEAKP